MVFYATKHKPLVNYQKAVSPIKIDGLPINFVTATEHVGIIRSSDGNLPHIQGRVTAHIKALYALLPCNITRNRNTNPAASLRIHQIYALPVLLSGVAALTLLQSEINVLHSHHSKSLLNLQKLHKNTPESFILFMAGSTGLTASLHTRQLSLFGMITRLPENILFKFAQKKLYSEPDNSSSWFVQVRNLCTKYKLPSPLFLLANPPSKSSFKNLVKKKVLDFWQNLLRSEALSKPSLKYFKPQFMSLQTPHPLWTTSNHSVFETNKSVVVARLLSGRYMSDWHTRHWSPNNKEGHCLLCPGKNLAGTIEHLLVHCEALEEKRQTLLSYLHSQTQEHPQLRSLFTVMLSSPTDNLVQFLLDPSVTPPVISGCQENLFSLKDIFTLCRTFCYGIHRRRLQLLGRFNFQ